MALVSLANAEAAVTNWSTTDGGRMRLAALSEGKDNRITAILEIRPDAGWKTYWRDPGDAGVPPSIDLTGTENLKLLKISYPAPEVSDDEDGRFQGYHRPVSLVLELERPEPDQQSVLNAQVLVGLCKDICVPFQSVFSLRLGDAKTAVADEFMKIRLANAMLPEAPSPGFEVTGSKLSADGQSFEVTLALPGIDAPVIAVAPSAGLLLGKHTEIVTGKGEATIRYSITRHPRPNQESAITLLVKSGGRAMETTLAVR